ncbi:probable amino acid permease 7 [Asparagus officinalis]|nr:probable amino acid permease 7 [Asparagus officinalis]
MGSGGGGTRETTENITLLRNHKKESDGDLIKRTGNVYTAVAHIITAVVGSGVLSLSWSVAQLGWIAGPAAILFFAAVTLVQATLLANCYRSPDPEHGHIRNKSYMGAVKQNLGDKSHLVCSFLQLTNMYGCCVAYTITAAASIRGIWQSSCYRSQGNGAPCSYEITSCTLIFGVSQIILSQIPDFHNMAWLSVVAALMSFSYSFIGCGLGVAKVIGN